MAQHDYNLINQSGANFRADLNNALTAIVSNNSGSSEPTTKFAYEFWVDETSGKMKLRNSANNAWITMPFNIGVNNSVDINVGTVNGLTSFSFNSGATVTSILDEDNFNSNSATALATQQSIKSYVDSQVGSDYSLSNILAVGNSSGGTNINLSTTDRVQFRDSAIYVFSSTDGTLDLKADGEIQLSAPYIDLAAANVNVDGTIDAVGVEFNTLSGTGSVTITDIVDEDNMGSNSPTKLATQQSIKSYVDSQVTAQDLDITDGSNTIGIDLDSETLSLLGGTGVSSSASGNGVTFAIGQPVGTSNNVVFNQVTASVVGNATSATVLQNARTISGISFNGSANITLNTSTITENTNLYFTTARANSNFDTRLATKSTSNLAEGTNLYYTSSRFDSAFGNKTTANLSENSNLYYTDARVQAVSINNVVEDTTPQLGGNLDVNGNSIISTSNGAINLAPDGSGVVVFKGNATKGSGQFILNCEANTHGITIKGAPHSAGASYTLTLPNNAGTNNQVLTTNGSGLLTWSTPSSGGSTPSITDNGNANAITIDSNELVAFTEGTKQGYNKKSYYGGSDEMQLYFDGVEGVLRVNGGSGNRLNTRIDEFEVTSQNNSKTLAHFKEDGSCDLYYNNSKKFETTTAGIDITGTVNLDNLTIAGAQGSNGQVLTSTGSGIGWAASGGGGGSYNNASVDAHLNKSTASTNEVLSWNGSDYDWVAQSGGGGGSNTITVQDEGSTLSTAASTLNFVGSGVTASGTGATKTITISGGGGGGSGVLSGGVKITLANGFSNQTIPRNVVTKIGFDHVLFGNSNNAFNTTNNTYTVPSAGKYLFLGKVRSENFQTTANGQVVSQVYLYKNGTQLPNYSTQQYSKSSGADIIRFVIDVNNVWDLAQNDVIDFRYSLSNYTATNGVDLSGNGVYTTNCYMYIVKIE